MGAQSAVKRLPAPLRKDLEERLKTFLAGKSSLDQIMSWLEGHAALFGVEADTLPSRSSVGRYAQNFEVVVQRVQRARELTELIAEQSGPSIADGKGVQVAIQLVQGLVYELLAGMAEGTSADAKTIHDLAKAIHHMAAAQKTDTDRALKIELEVRKKAAAAGGAEAKAMGLTEDKVRQIEKAILGVER